MIRFFFVVTFLILFLVLSTPLLLFLWLMGNISPKKRDLWALHIVQWAFRVILFITGVKTDYIGLKHIPRDTPVLYIGNHRSFFDVHLTYIQCPNLTGYISKKEMEKMPLLNIWMRLLHCLFLDRDNPKEGLKTILAAIQKVKDGISITIFPEGTRNKGEELSLLPFKPGSLKIAEKTGCPIVPIAINQSSAIFEDHFPKIKPTHVIVEYLEPIYPTALTKEEKKDLLQTCQNRIQETLIKNAQSL